MAVKRVLISPYATCALIGACRGKSLLVCQLTHACIRVKHFNKIYIYLFFASCSKSSIITAPFQQCWLNSWHSAGGLDGCCQRCANVHVGLCVCVCVCGDLCLLLQQSNWREKHRVLEAGDRVFLDVWNGEGWWWWWPQLWRCRIERVKVSRGTGTGRGRGGSVYFPWPPATLLELLLTMSSYCGGGSVSICTSAWPTASS